MLDEDLFWATYGPQTFAFALNLLGVSVFTACLLLMFLALTALVEVLDDDSDKHVEHKEADEQQE